MEKNRESTWRLQKGIAVNIKPIRTKYAGVLFRSRQEARWAVLFDLLSVEWQYEPEGFQLPSQWYVPDFWLPRQLCFAEVKGVAEQWDTTATRKVSELAYASERSVILCTNLSAVPTLLDVVHPCKARDSDENWMSFD